MRRVIVAMAAAMICGLVAVSCTLMGDQFSGADDVPEMSVGEAYRAALGYLPADAELAYVTVQDGSEWNFWGENLLPLANPEGEPGAPGTLVGLEADMERLNNQFYNIDYNKMEAMVISGTYGDDFGGVAFGDFDEFPDTREIEIGGRTAYQLDIRHWVEEWDGHIAEDVPEVAYMMEIEKPYPGVVVRTDAGVLQQVVENEGALAAGHIDHLAAIFDDAGTAEFGLALGGSMFEPVDEVVDDSAFPDAAMMAFGKESITISMAGDQQLLNSVDAMVSRLVSELRSDLDESYRNIEKEDPMAYFMLYAYHVVEGLAPQLEPVWNEGRLRYDLELSGTSLGALISAAVAGGSYWWDGFMEVDEEYYHRGDEW